MKQMKKILLFSLALVVATVSFAQTSVNIDFNEKELLKPVKKNISVDVDFTPFDGAKVVSMKAINLRYFFKNDIAIRLGLNFEYNSKDEDISDLMKNSSDDVLSESFGDKSSSTVLWGFNIGFEKHFKGTDRLSPYLGVDVIYNHFNSKMDVFSKHVDNDLGFTTSVYMSTEGSTSIAKWRNISDGYRTNEGLIIDQPEDRAYSEIGLNLIAGVNYYVIKHLYLGVEMGFGFKNKWTGKVSAKNYSEKFYTNSNFDNNDLEKNKMSDMNLPNRSQFLISKNINSAIKLGFVF